jgi:hypothetical protein
VNTDLEVILRCAGGKTITFYQKENAERKELNESLMKKKASRQAKEFRRRRVPDGTGTS